MIGTQNPDSCGLGQLGKILTLLIILLWVIVFLAGVLVDSGPYRNQIASGGGGIDFGRLLIIWVIVLLVYTPTNVAILSIFMGILGALGRCATLSLGEEDSKEFEKDLINPYLSGLIRGFIVYLLIISGLVIILEQVPLSPTGPEQYIRLASVISVSSFVVSYNPKYFGKLLHKASRVLTARKTETPNTDPE